MKPVKRFFGHSENVAAALMLGFLLFVPAILGAYETNSYTYYLTCVILSFSITLIWGFTGIFSFGQAAFLGISGYSYGIIAQLLGTKVATPLAAVLALCIATAVSALIGYFMFYGGINDVFVGLITLCVTLVLETFMGQTSGSQWQIGKVKLGGYNGLSKIPMLQFGGFKFDAVGFYYFVLLITVAVYLALRHIQRSGVGYSLVAIRENRQRSELFGYNIKLIQTLVFAAGGALAGLSGILYAAWGNYITPASMSLESSTIPVILVAAGGRKNVTAAMLFSFFYYWLSRTLSATGSQYALIVLGIFLVLVILFVPEGFLALIFQKLDRAEGRAE